MLSGSQRGFIETVTLAPPNLFHSQMTLTFHMDHIVQVDMILLDFSKAFDTMPHCHLLKKLKFYHIENQLSCSMD